MPTGFSGLYFPEVDHRDTETWNHIVSELDVLIRREFLPSLGLKFDSDFQSWHQAGGGYKPFDLEYLLYPRYASGWHFGDMKGEEGGVFVFGPFANRENGPKNMTIFCTFEFQHQVREFFEKLNKFVAAKVFWILEEMKPIGYAALWAA